jgi:hypothetical protein
MKVELIKEEILINVINILNCGDCNLSTIGVGTGSWIRFYLKCRTRVRILH